MHCTKQCEEMGSLSRSQSEHPKLMMTTPSSTATATAAMMLKVNRASHLIKKSSPPAPATKPITTPTPPAPGHHRQPVIIYTHSPKVIHTKPQDFMALVQKLTGYDGGSDDNNKTKLPPPHHQLQPPAVVVPSPPPPTPLLPLPIIPPPPDKLYYDDFETKNYVMAFMNGNNNNSSLVGLGLFDMDDSPSSIIMEDHQEYINNNNIKSCSSNGGREVGSPPLNNSKYNIMPPVFDQTLPICFAPGYGDFCCTDNNINSNGFASTAMINNSIDHQTISAYYNNTAAAAADGRRENNGTGYCFYNDVGPLHVSTASPPSVQEDMNHLTTHFV